MSGKRRQHSALQIELQEAVARSWQRNVCLPWPKPASRMPKASTNGRNSIHGFHLRTVVAAKPTCVALRWRDSVRQDLPATYEPAPFSLPSRYVVPATAGVCTLALIVPAVFAPATHARPLQPETFEAPSLSRRFRGPISNDAESLQWACVQSSPQIHLALGGSSPRNSSNPGADHGASRIAYL